MQTLLTSEIAILEIDWPYVTTESGTLPLELKAAVHMEEPTIASSVKNKNKK